MIAQQSLLRRLLFTFFIVLTFIWLSIFLWDCYELNPNQQQDTESELLGTAHRILVVVQSISDRPAEIPAVVAKMEKLHYVFYSHNWHWRNPGLQTQIWKGSTLLYNSAIPTSGSHTASIHAMRMLEQQPLPQGWVSSIATDPQSGITIRMTTEFFGHWTVLGINSIGYYVNPLLFSLPFLLLPAWLIIRRGLRPLNSIVNEIEERSGANLSPLQASSYLELSPLVAATNRLMAALCERLEREQEFLIDAAHEIKTPLAIIHINAGALHSALTPQLMDEAKVGLLLGVERATHTVSQLLALSLTLPQSDADNDDDNLAQTDLILLLQNQISAMAQLATQRNIRITLHAPAQYVLQLHRDSMASLIDNLLSNAIKYSPRDSLVTVSVKLRGDCVQLIVSDQGPGIEPALREKVFERFFRLPGHAEPGSGLGLAIAARAAERNHASVYLKTGEDGIGLAAVVELSVTALLQTSGVRQKAQTLIQSIRGWPVFFAEKIYRMRTQSLFRRILLGFMIVVAGMWMCYLGWDVYDAKTAKVKDMQGELKRTEQRMLVAMQALSDRPAKISAVVDKLADLHYAFYKKRQWYTPLLQTQIWQSGKLIYATANPKLPSTMSNASPQQQPLPDGWTSWIESDRQTGITIRMATELIADWFLDRNSIGYFIKPLLFCLPLLLLLTAFVIRFGLRPLAIIVKEIEVRSPANLSPLRHSPYAELAPVVTSVNRLMQRLEERLQREQEFLHDAARELDKALTQIQTHLNFLEAKHDASRIDEVCAGLRLATDQAAHTVHQLLALSRSGSDRDKGDFQHIDFIELLQDRLALVVPNAMQRKIKIALYSPEHCPLSMHRESMIALIDNLINNAVQYAPDNSKVAVSVKIDGKNIRLIVADKGPGIAPEFRQKVFERFFSYPGRPDSSRGLGLAIAARAAARNFGMIFLETGRNGTGLQARVDFPSAAVALT